MTHNMPQTRLMTQRDNALRLMGAESTQENCNIFHDSDNLLGKRFYRMHMKLTKKEADEMWDDLPDHAKCSLIEQAVMIDEDNKKFSRENPTITIRNYF